MDNPFEALGAAYQDEIRKAANQFVESITSANKGLTEAYSSIAKPKKEEKREEVYADLVIKGEDVKTFQQSLETLAIGIKKIGEILEGL